MSVIEVGGLPKELPRGKTAERILFAELLSRLETMQESQTAFMERFQGRLLNNVLHVEKAVFDSTGFITRFFHAPAGCVYVDNPSTHTVTVTSAGSVGAAPTSGVGVFDVPAGKSRTVALGSTVFTLYGTATDTVSFQVFSIGAQPGVI